MAKKFFMRNDPETIKNASEMTEEEFVTHYSDTVSTPDALRKAYKEMTKKVGVQQPGKRETHVKNEEPLALSERIESDGDKVMVSKLGASVIVETQTSPKNLKEQLALFESAEATGAKKKGKAPKEKKEKDPSAPKKEGGFVKTEEGTKRDERIKELLGQKMPVAKILDTMTTEGIKVFGPQIYKIKKELDSATK